MCVYYGLVTDCGVWCIGWLYQGYDSILYSIAIVGTSMELDSRGR